MSSSIQPYLGCKISIISKSEFRYEGVLYTVDPKESTIALAKVKSFGTEGRPTDRPIAPRDEIHEYIIFRASDIKDLHVCEPPKLHGPAHDPAIVQQSGPVSYSSSANQSYNTIYGLAALQNFPSQMGANYCMPSVLPTAGQSGSNRYTSQSVQRKSPTSDAGVQVSVDENVGRNYQRSDYQREPLRQRNSNQMNYQPRRRASFSRQTNIRRGNSRRGTSRDRNNGSIDRFENEYDFEQANAEFQELESKLSKNSTDDGVEQSQNVEDLCFSYDKKKSFFDDISCEATQRSKGENTSARGKMAVKTALQEVLKISLTNGKLSRGLREAAKSLYKRHALLCVLATNCDESHRVGFAEHQINLQKAHTPSNSRWDETPGIIPKGSEMPGATPGQSTRMWDATPAHATPDATTPGHDTAGHKTTSARRNRWDETPKTDRETPAHGSGWAETPRTDRTGTDLIQETPTPSASERCSRWDETPSSQLENKTPQTPSMMTPMTPMTPITPSGVTPTGPTPDAECTLNSIVSLLIMVPQSESDYLVHTFCEKLTRAPNSKMANVCLKVLQNLFAGIGEHSMLCYDVYCSLVRVAGQTDSIHLIFKDLNKLKVWLNNMKISTEKIQKLLRLLHEVLIDCKQSELAGKVMIELLGTYTEDNASQARDDAHKCIVASLGDPNTFLMDHLLALKPVRFLEGELIHDLLTIFVSEKLSAYLMFYGANKDFVNSLGLSHEQNLQKMRLLTFMQMAENKREIPFNIIESELQIKTEEVEGFIIDGRDIVEQGVENEQVC